MILKHFECFVHVVTALTLAAFTGCGEKQGHSGPPAHPPPVARVRVEPADLQSVISSEEIVGTVRSKLRATLEARQSGRIDKFPYTLGDKVQGGELLAELESSASAARVQQAKASLEQAEREWQRISALFDANSATRAESDAAQSRLAVARGALAEAEANLNHARVIAPFDGVITKKWLDAGDFATPGKPLVEIENLTALQVEIDIPESLSAGVERHASLPVVADYGVNTTGIITEISPSVDATTRSRRVKIELKQGSFAPGQFVRVSIPLKEQMAILVSKDAVVERGQLEIVFTSEQGRARMHVVKSRPHGGGRVEILSGVRAGEIVVIEGAAQLVDGQPVEVR